MKISRRGVPRVVWERKKPDSPPGQDSEVNLIPFLSVSRSLGDYWSWNQQTQKFVVSPEPDVSMHPLDTSTHRFIVVASDGLWNVMTPQEVVDFVWAYETKGEEEEEEEEGEGGEGEKHHQTRDVVRALIDEALYRWLCRGMCADNIAVVITFLTEGALPSFAGSKFGQSAAASKPSSTCCPESPASRQPTADQPSPSPPAVIHHVHTSSSGSTLYHKETRDGMCFEEHVRVSLRCRRKDKQRLKEKQRKRFHGMQGPGDEGEGEGEGTKETLPQKRQRLEKASILLPSRSYSDRDSGCESGSERREATTTEISVHPLSIPISSPSVSTPSSPLPAPSSLVSVPCSSVSTSSSPIPVPASSVSGAGEGSSGMESSPDTISPSHSPPPAMDCLPMPPGNIL